MCKKVTGSSPIDSKKGAILKNVCFEPLKTRKAPKIKDFKVLVMFWLRQSEVMLRIVMLLTPFAVM